VKIEQGRCIALVAVAGCVLALSWQAPAIAQDGAATRAGRMFEDKCASCHTVPAPKFETDRAWLRRVKDTA